MADQHLLRCDRSSPLMSYCHPGTWRLSCIYRGSWLHSNVHRGCLLLFDSSCPYSFFHVGRCNNDHCLQQYWTDYTDTNIDLWEQSTRHRHLLRFIDVFCIYVDMYIHYLLINLRIQWDKRRRFAHFFNRSCTHRYTNQATGLENVTH